jgi:D-amino-acid dehydrogenase
MNKNRIHIIGGGINGLCTAWYLVKEGFEVTIIDGSNLTDGTSFGNAGMIVPSHFLPLPTPGAIKNGLKWMLDKKSPLYIRPRLSFDLMQFLWGFVSSAKQEKIEKGSKVLLELNQRSKDLYEEISIELGHTIHFEKKGLLMLYNTLKQEEEEKELAHMAQDLGLSAQILTPSELQSLEPETQPIARGGLLFPGDAHLNPGILMQKLLVKLKQKGVEILDNTQVKNIECNDKKALAVITSRGKIPVEEVIVAAGIWTKYLVKDCGINLNMQDGKGYSITTENDRVNLRIPTILSEAKVAITPMGPDLRIAGTMELSGLSKDINYSRVKTMLDSIEHYYENFPVDEEAKKDIWVGYRPMSFDGIPYIGKSKKCTNLTIATGHGMMGLSLGAVTGKIVKDLILGGEQDIKLDSLHIDR